MNKYKFYVYKHNIFIENITNLYKKVIKNISIAIRGGYFPGIGIYFIGAMHFAG